LVAAHTSSDKSARRQSQSRREVVEITPTEIRLKTASGATLAFYRTPEVDYGVAYRARLKQVGLDASKEEFQLRSLEAVVNLHRSHHPSADVDTAKAAVLAAIKEAAPSMRKCVYRKQLDLETLVCSRGPNFPLSRLVDKI
jgi:hypothetical protein